MIALNAGFCVGCGDKDPFGKEGGKATLRRIVGLLGVVISALVLVFYALPRLSAGLPH